jgi:hypothetical protein
VVDAGSTQDELLYDLGVERSEINAAQASKKAYSSSQQCLMFKYPSPDLSQWLLLAVDE